MSSFKRRAPSKQVPLPVGTRVSPSSSTTYITSTGIPSLDDILGGGLPLSCSSLTLAPDLHSAYGELVQKYFIAQGLACGQRVCVVDDSAREFVSECMWTPGAGVAAISPSQTAALEDEEEEKMDEQDNKIKIAWRYEQMKKFQTTVTASNPSTAEDYCRTFDLTCRIPDVINDAATGTSQLVCLDVTSLDVGELSTRRILRQITELLQRPGEDAQPAQPIRICIPMLGSPSWGDLRPQDVLFFLHLLRALLRRYPHACASLCLSPHLCTDDWGGPGWIHKLSWLSDASITLSAFSADLSLSALFSSHHGLVHIHALPAPHTLLPPSDKFSTLRGVSASASSASGGGENNLAFKCMRKRLVFETLHLDVEGGVTERRTTPSVAAEIGLPGAEALDRMEPGKGKGVEGAVEGAVAKVQVGFEGGSMEKGKANEREKEGGRHKDNLGNPVMEMQTERKPVKKARKKVAFGFDKPDLYDF